MVAEKGQPTSANRLGRSAVAARPNHSGRSALPPIIGEKYLKVVRVNWNTPRGTCSERTTDNDYR